VLSALIAMAIATSCTALLVTFLLNQNEPTKRMFKVKRTTRILCLPHAKKLKRGQVALIDPDRCKTCLDKRPRK
jgi:hypothetical protein